MARWAVVREGPMDWTKLGQQIREAAEETVASGGMEAAAIEVRRRLCGHSAHNSPLTAHHSQTVRDLVVGQAPEDDAACPEGVSS